MLQPDTHPDSQTRAERVFFALADPTRRAVLEALGDGPASVGALAEPHAMALPSFLRHIEVLEAAGLVTTEKVGRKRMVALSASGLAPAVDWLAARSTPPAPAGVSARRKAVAERLAQPEPGAPAAEARPTRTVLPASPAPKRRLPPWAARRSLTEKR